MTERVTTLELGITWDPNAPDAALSARDSGETTLDLNAHPDDLDRRRVVLSWTGTAFAAMGEPNDEALGGHRLYDKGLADVRWIGVVHDSPLIEELERRNSVHWRHSPARYAALTHHVVLLKERTVEVVAHGIEVRRGPDAADGEQLTSVQLAPGGR